MERIEFGFFDAGGGHRAAATALEMSIRAQQRPWEVQLTNLQELLDAIDILRKYAGIRIQDAYNLMLRNGWTLGSPQLMRVLQLAIRMYHRPTVRMLEAHWKKLSPTWWFPSCRISIARCAKAYGRVFPGRPFVTIITDIADYPPHFWIERQPQYLICGSDRAVAQARAMGHADDRIFRASGMILHPRFYDVPVVDPHGDAREARIAARSSHRLVLFGGYGSKAMLEIAERLDQLGARSAIDLRLRTKRKACGRAARTQIANARIRRRFHDARERIHAARGFFHRQARPRQRERSARDAPAGDRRMQCVDAAAGALQRGLGRRKEVGVVLRNFREIDKAVAKLIEPATLARYRANADSVAQSSRLRDSGDARANFRIVAAPDAGCASRIPVASPAD